MKLDYGPAFKYPFNGSGWIKKFLLGGLSTLILPLSFGFFIRSYRRIIQGADDEMPDWNEVMDLFSMGIISLLIVITYLLPSVILMLIGYLLIGGSNGLISSTGAISFIAMFLSVVIFLGFLLFLFSLVLLPMGLAFYADTLDIMEALRFSQVIKKVFDNVETYFLALFLYISAAGAILGMFVFLLPFAVFYLQMVYAHIFAQLYIKCQQQDITLDKKT